MSAALIIVTDPILQPLASCAPRIKRAQVKVVILYGPLQALDEEVVLTLEERHW
jgi:hypothetical protein